MENINEVTMRNLVKCAMQPGDVVLVDNYQVPQFGRWEGPQCLSTKWTRDHDVCGESNGHVFQIPVELFFSVEFDWGAR